MSELDHSKNDCLLVAIMTHGDNGSVEAFDFSYKIDDIKSMFTDENCPTLAGKPRLFFIQACQGSKIDFGQNINVNIPYVLNRSINQEINVNSTRQDANPFREIIVAAEKKLMYNPLKFQHFLIAQSTVPKFVSYRNTLYGSWFIQALCNELDENGTSEDILHLLTHVNLAVSNYQCDHPGKQTTCTTTMLTKVLRFNIKSKLSQTN